MTTLILQFSFSFAVPIQFCEIKVSPRIAWPHHNNISIKRKVYMLVHRITRQQPSKLKELLLHHVIIFSVLLETKKFLQFDVLKVVNEVQRFVVTCSVFRCTKLPKCSFACHLKFKVSLVKSTVLNAVFTNKL